jgi:Ca2+-binding RTX toxin-like protein
LDRGIAKRVTARVSGGIRRAIVSALICAGLVVSLAPSPNVAAAPNPQSVYVDSISYGGSGCPQGTVGQSVGNDRLTFTMIFDTFVASIGPSIPIAESTKSCQFDISLHAPAGWTWTIAAFQARGYVQLDDGISATHSLEFAGRSATHQTDFAGQVAKDYLAASSTPPLLLSSAECGGDGVLTVTETLSLIGDAGTDDQGQITLDSLDGKLNGGPGSPAGFQIVWSQCTPLCFDQASQSFLPATKWLAEPGTLTGTPGRDVLIGSLGRDTIKGLAGNDVICSAPSDGPPGDLDKIDGGSGRDSITGAGTLLGGTSDDLVYAVGAGSIADGGSGNDTLWGELAASLLGNSGNDKVINLNGTPKIDCGSGSDQVFANGATGVRRCESTLPPPP